MDQERLNGQIPMIFMNIAMKLFVHIIIVKIISDAQVSFYVEYLTQKTQSQLGNVLLIAANRIIFASI